MDSDGLQAWLVERVAALVDLPAGRIDPDDSFSEHGLDSVKLALIVSELEEIAGRQVDLGLLFEHPTIASLARHLVSAGPDDRRPAGRGEVGEPVAIVGLACRLPGAAGAEQFWRLAETGVDAITEVTPERWEARTLYHPEPSMPGRTISKWGGFIDDVAMFDARFFRISPQEATRMDPQHRLLLETCWEALEDAGEVPSRLRSSRTGVYVGISVNDYGHRQLGHRERISPHTVTGNSLAVAANRLSYMFDFRGPSMAVDTACSSSLVAAHLACRALRSGECDRAVVAGVNLLLDPDVTIGLSKAGMLAPDGRCKAFDARANGYVRGEGCGAVILKPVSDALAAGDRIYAVIRGSAVNQDGASNGLTAPNPAAQRAVLQSAYRDAGVDPAAVQYVECHGTGTFLGDPIEAQSLGAVLSAGRAPGDACLIGSVKTNLGHLEAAAGIAGLLKVALAMHHGVLPPSLHFVHGNPHIPFDQLGLRVVTEVMTWPVTGDHRLAGLSSFGFGGTNAHMVLEAAPPARPTPEPSGPVVLPISARSRQGLERLLDAWACRLATADASEVGALAYTAAVRRTHHRPFRVAIIAADSPSLARRVQEAAADRTGPQRVPVHRAVPRVAFVFSGQGSQWPGMGRTLLEADPLFCSTIRRADETLAVELGWSIEAQLRGDDDQDLDDTAVAQPLLVSLQLALARVWRASGIEPAAVVGHSLGEISAAAASGMIDFETGLRLAERRGRAMAASRGAGGMLAVGLTRDEAQRTVDEHPGAISLAAINGRRATVLSGDVGALEQVRVELVGRGALARWLTQDYPFHSYVMERPSETLTTELAGLRTQPPAVPFYSTVLGGKALEGEVDGGYWGRGVRATVDFAAAMESLLDQGMDAIVEIGPQPVLRGALRELTEAAGRHPPVVVHSLERDHDDHRQLLDGLGRLYGIGCPVRWDHLFPAGGRVVSLPAHPWERERYWIEREEGGNGRLMAAAAHPFPAAEDPPGPNDLAVAQPTNGQTVGGVEPDPSAPEAETWLYEPLWHEQPAASGAGSRGGVQPGRWLVLEDRSGVGHGLVQDLRRRGVPVLACRPAASFSWASAGEVEVNPWDETHYQRIVDELAAGPEPLDGAIHLWGLDAPSRDEAGALHPESTVLPAASVLHLMRALSFAAGSAAPRLIVVSRGCQAVSAGGTAISGPLPATMWGLLKTAHIEIPTVSTECIDLDPSDDDAVARLWQEMAGETLEAEVAYRQGQRFVRRLVPVAGSSPLPPGRALELGEDATYVIAGGTGGVGLLVAARLVERGARHVALIARGTERPAAVTALEALRDAGATVHVVPADVGDRAGLARALEAIRSSGPPIRGVLHAAGLRTDGALLDMTTESLRRVLEPKVLGGWNLHELTADDPLEWFVLFSSAAGILGSPGQANYSAANAFLDSLAHHRHQLGLPATVIDWGPWAGAGMAEDLGETGIGRRLRTAASTIDGRDGLAIFEWLLASDRIQTVVLPFDLRHLLQFYPAGPGASFFTEIATEEVAALKSIGLGPSARPELDTEFVGPRHGVEQRIGRIWQKSLGIEPIGVFDGFFELGGDSVLGNQILVEINRLLGVSIDAERAFGDFTVSGLAALAEEQMIDRIQQMSDEEVVRVLDERGSGSAYARSGPGGVHERGQ